MYIPATRERVRIKGRAELFLVLALNREDGLAYLVDLDRDSGYVETVRFDLIQRNEAAPTPCRATPPTDPANIP